MEKYFKEEELEKRKLSEYLKMSEKDFKYPPCEEKYRKVRTERYIKILGDIELDYDMYETFIHEFDILGGRYDVRVTKETIKGIYEISQMYPFLTGRGLELFWSVYIYDLFEIYDLSKKFQEYLDRYGRTEEALSEYLKYVRTVADEYDKAFYEEAKKVSKYCKDCDYSLITFLQAIIKGQHIPFEKIKSCMPSQELIKKDEEQLRELVERYRIYFGACYPISYQMIEKLVTGQGLDSFPEQPKYFICRTEKIDTTFTKQEFLSSIEDSKDQKAKEKILK